MGTCCLTTSLQSPPIIMGFIKFLLFALLGVVFFVDKTSSTLHGLCSDVSIYDDIEYKPASSKKCCGTKMVKKCEKKSEERCNDVTEIKCDVVGFPVCTPRPKKVGGLTKCTPVFHDYDYYDCEEIKENVKHKKKLPECKTVTKDNCVTEWDHDENGNKVWTGAEKCTPVSWEECSIVDKEVDFPIVKTDCKVVSQIKWNTFVEEDVSDAEYLEVSCEVKADLNCREVKTKSCDTVEFEECKMTAKDDCRQVEVFEPFQEKKHLKKCLT